VNWFDFLTLILMALARPSVLLVEAVEEWLFALFIGAVLVGAAHQGALAGMPSLV
jgi:hypothetical protein